MNTVKQLVLRVHEMVVEEGMDVSPHDVGHIIGLFLEGLVHHPTYASANDPLQRIADECESIKDEPS